MSMGLLFPAALAALAALLLPLVIHIARKSEQLPTDFAALRWLRSRPKPRSRLRFDEWPLLLLRLVLLALAALWLAQPVLFGAGDERPYVAVVPGAQVDQGSFADARIHWLAPGFPKIDTAQPTGQLPIASLIRQLDAELPAKTPLTIVTPTILDGADADRLRLSRKVAWRVSGEAKAAPDKVAPPPTLAIRSDADHRAALRYIRAAALAWQPANRNGEVDSSTPNAPLPDKGHILVWLSGGTMLDSAVDWVKQGGTMIVASDTRLPADQTMVPLWRDADGQLLAEATVLGKGRLIRFTRLLQPSQMPVLLDADFPSQLRTLLTPTISPTRVTATDYTPLTGGRAYDQPPQQLRPWLAILIALLLLAERWLATRRRRSIAP
ncbi:N-terminal double-transmembrane domain-containing protein [Sphingobium sp. AP50]|uniref:BatA domain-containing protein n=1 Tax=Sphingobium sp. AP50 TaxID=1884369 RepID=UPI0008D7DB72|nr:BatA domain-containing protein [Sphingobium sp. AP50]SEJ65428.1 N-terminal double-transmembrane domain-containing protein [Sphingobium sp. AP50]